MAALTSWLYGLGALLGAGAAVDANKRADHQADLMREENQRQLDQAEKINRESIAAQERINAANLAQARRAAAESKSLMDKQLKAADENMNRATQKRPNTARIVDEAAQAGKAGASGTMLTGPQGVDPSSLQLGRNTLLGQ